MKSIYYLSKEKKNNKSEPLVDEIIN